MTKVRLRLKFIIPLKKMLIFKLEQNMYNKKKFKIRKELRVKNRFLGPPFILRVKKYGFIKDRLPR